MRAVAGAADRKLTAALPHTDDVSALSAVPTHCVTVSPGPGVPQVCGCTGATVTGLHVRRFVSDTLQSSVSFSPASSAHTHHLPALHTRPALRRTSVCPISEVPVGDARTHVTVLAVLWAEPVIALPVIHSVAVVTDTTHIPGSLSHSTIHRTRAPVGADLPV